MKKEILNVIILPPHKLFYLPSISIWTHYNSRNEPCVIIPGNKNFDEVKKLHPAFEVANKVREQVEEYDGVNFVVLQHSSERHFQNFVVWLEDFEKRVPPENVTVTFVPDGFGNTMIGPSYIKKLDETRGRSANVKEYLSFGFMDKSTENMAGMIPANCIDMSLLADEFDRNEDIKAMSNVRSLERLIGRDMVFLPFRPWCTKRFQHGAYDFGSIQELSCLYGQLIAEAWREDNLKDPIVLYRPDERFDEESNEVREALSKSYEVLDTQDFYPQSLTIEPMLYYLFSMGFVRKASMVCLDSTSFQMMPFLLNKIPTVKFSALLGAKSERVLQMTKSSSFVSGRLRNKLHHFRGRYATMLNDGYIQEHTIIDETCSIVKLSRSIFC